MANSYTWIISELEAIPHHEGHENVVSVIHWRRQVDDGKGHVSDIYGTQEIKLNPDENFVSFNNLTSKTVVAWLEGAIGVETITNFDRLLDTQIAELINPPVVTLLPPWVE